MITLASSSFCCALENFHNCTHLVSSSLNWAWGALAINSIGQEEMAQIESAGTVRISSPQQPPLPPTSPQTSLTMEAHDPPQPLSAQGKQATIHDFLSLCGTGASPTSSTTVSNHGLQQSSTTQDLLQPLQKSLIPAAGGSSSNLTLPNGYVYSASKPFIGNIEPAGSGQQSCYVFGNGSFEVKESFQTKCRSGNISFGPKGHVPHALPLNNKQWHQQGGVEVLDGNRRLSRVPSEDDDDEDDESFDHIYSAKKDGRYQKVESMQQVEGRNQDNKGATPRSKHSATEQRRRSKINDRFQMLRQLLPNADQKRDKASFLLEVIEYIQMLHEKVKKYEGSDFFRGQQPQERIKMLSWDRSCGQQDVTFTPTQDAKEVPDANGYARGRLSPLRAMSSEDGITKSDLMCTMVQASPLHGVSSYESKPLISKPIPLTFSHASAPAIADHQASNPMHQTNMMAADQGQTVFGQLLRQDQEPATSKARCGSQLNKAGTALPLPQYIQQPRNVLISQDAPQVADQKVTGYRSNDQNLSALNFRRLEDAEGEGRARSSQMTDVNSSSVKDINRLHVGCHERGAPAVSDGSEVEKRTEQEAPAVLGGVINISSVYSQGLLDTLTRALQSSGVDLAQATISVQIDLGKPEASSSKQMISLPYTSGVSTIQSNQAMASNESEPSKKRLKAEAD